MPGGKARLPPRWFIVTAWHIHRRIVRASGGRRGLRPPSPGKYGTLRLTTTGRRSGEPRSVILGYHEDGPNLVSMAMNGWGAPEPAWWLNLQAHPEAIVELAGGVRSLISRCLRYRCQVELRRSPAASRRADAAPTSCGARRGERRPRQ